MYDPIAPPIQALLELFGSELSTVKFPDVDGASLQQAAQRAQQAAESLARAEAALEAARVSLAESQEQLLQKAQRALAYARVFTEDDPELSAKVEAIALPRAARKPAPAAALPADPNAPAAPPRRRGRPPKNPAANASLFGANGSTGELSVEAVEQLG